MDQTNNHPLIHIRMHSDYQSSIKGLAPDVTVTVNVTSLPLDGIEFYAAINKAREIATKEFTKAIAHAWEDLKIINAELAR
jgi:hypothetical protein